MNRQIAALGGSILVAYLVLFVQLNRVQVVDAAELQRHEDNSRPLVADFGAPRGEIRTADGTVLARSLAVDDGPFDNRRDYPTGELFASVTGYLSFDAGSDGLELTWDDELRGERNALTDSLRELLGGESTTADLVVTLSTPLQRIAQEALGERNGSVVVLDAQSGAVEALWSYPSFDPNPLSSIDTAKSRAARAELLADPTNPLRVRATRELYFPGSTFKVVAAAAGLESGRVTLDAPTFPSTTSYTPPLTSNELSNFADSECGGPLRDLIRRSCNAGMAQMVVEVVGPDPLIATAEAFGFNERPPIDLPGVEASVMPSDFGEPLGRDVEVDPFLLEQYTASGSDLEAVGLLDDMPALAQSAIGQFEVKATPLQMALLAAAIANDGDVPEPHVVQSVIDANGETVYRAPLNPWRSAVEPRTAAELREAMVAVVDSGTGSRLAIDGLVVGAKTGTAQLGADLESTHAWVIAFAGDDLDRPEVAIAVIVEADEDAGEQTGGRVAAPVAQRVLDVWRTLR